MINDRDFMKRLILSMLLMTNMAYANHQFTNEDLVGLWQCDLFIEELSGNITKSTNIQRNYPDGVFIGYGETRQIREGKDISVVFMSSNGTWDIKNNNEMTTNILNIPNVIIYDAISKTRETEKELATRLHTLAMFQETMPLTQTIIGIDANNFSYELGAINYGEIKQKSAHCTRMIN